MSTFSVIMPEIFLTLTLAFILIGEVTYYGQSLRLIIGTTFLGLLSAFVQVLLSYRYGFSQIFGGVLSIDGLSLFFKLLFILLAALAIGSIHQTKEIEPKRHTEYCALILAATLAMCLMASAADLILIFLSMLFFNVMTYFLSAYGRRSMVSTEASVKSFIFGAVSIAFLLYSFAILLATTRTLNIYQIHQVVAENRIPTQVLMISFILSFLSLCIQIGAFPMHLLVPDILEGSPTPTSGFLSVAFLASGFAIMIRFLMVIYAQPSSLLGQWQVLDNFFWTEGVAIVSGMTMLLGTLLAFCQISVKRLVGYLVVAEAGFLLMGLLVLDGLGIAAILYNLVIDTFALVGCFYVFSFCVDELRSDHFWALQGMLKHSVFDAFCLVLFLLCLVGSPPMPGFIGKFTLIGVAVQHQRLVLALAAIVSMVVATVAVLRLSYQLIGDFQNSEKNSNLSVRNLSRKTFLMTLLLPIILVGVFADWVLKWASQSLGFIFW